SSRETANEAFAGKDAIHVVLQRAGLAWQLDAEHRQTPENRCQTAVNETELLAHEEGHFGEYRCDADQALAQFLTCLGDGRLGTAGIGQHVNQGAPVALDRKSTRLNSSHVKISYAVFCL